MYSNGYIKKVDVFKTKLYQLVEIMLENVKKNKDDIDFKLEMTENQGDFGGTDSIKGKEDDVCEEEDDDGNQVITGDGQRDISDNVIGVKY